MPSVCHIHFNKISIKSVTCKADKAIVYSENLCSPFKVQPYDRLMGKGHNSLRARHFVY